MGIMDNMYEDLEYYKRENANLWAEIRRLQEAVCLYQKHVQSLLDPLVQEAMLKKMIEVTPPVVITKLK